MATVQRFNGATSFRTWKRRYCKVYAQRGGFNGATSFERGNDGGWQLTSAPKASMEPRPSNVETGCAQRKLCRVQTLQWSHVLPNVETAVLTDGHCGHGFNGATSFRTWKRIAAHGRAPGLRFNGATSFRTWKPCYRVHASGEYERFNGATSFRTWKRLVATRHSLVPQLQWSHVLPNVETAAW